MMGAMNIPHGETVYFDVVTHDPSTGELTNADSAPAWKVYPQTGDLPNLFGTMTLRSGHTGHYRASFAVETISGFDPGEFFQVVVEATVGGVTARTVVRSFRVMVAEETTGVPQVEITEAGQSAIVDTFDSESAGMASLGAAVATNYTLLAHETFGLAVIQTGVAASQSLLSHSTYGLAALGQAINDATTCCTNLHDWWQEEGVLYTMLDGVADDVGDVELGIAAIASTLSTGVALTESERNSTADAVLSRDVSNVEGSAGAFSLATDILGKYNGSISSDTLTIYQTDGETEYATAAVSYDSYGRVSGIASLALS